jgi:hypothetical protein
MRSTRTLLGYLALALMLCAGPAAGQNWPDPRFNVLPLSMQGKEAQSFHS